MTLCIIIIQKNISSKKNVNDYFGKNIWKKIMDSIPSIKFLDQKRNTNITKKVLMRINKNPSFLKNCYVLPTRTHISNI